MHPPEWANVHIIDRTTDECKQFFRKFLSRRFQSPVRTQPPSPLRTFSASAFWISGSFESMGSTSICRIFRSI